MIDDDQIRTLRREAQSVGDMVQVAVCELALGCDDPAALPDELDMTETQRAHLEALGLDDGHETIAQNARVQCAQVIAEAQS